jgi:hypothetical protein
MGGAMLNTSCHESTSLNGIFMTRNAAGPAVSLPAGPVGLAALMFERPFMRH